jgi:hypothetical protein
LWTRLRADSNSMPNDSIPVQFNDSLSESGSSAYRIGTTSSAEVVLQDGSTGAAPHGWGWADNGWGVLGPNVFFTTTGTHRLRVQQREDGAIIDQIVISPDRFLSAPPGSTTNDATIVAINEPRMVAGAPSQGPGPRFPAHEPSFACPARIRTTGTAEAAP